MKMQFVSIQFLMILVASLWQLNHSVADDNSKLFERSFGPQAKFRSNMKKMGIEGGADVKLALKKGDDISIPDGTNLVTLRDRKIVRVPRENLGIKADSVYLVGEIDFPENGRRAVYTCDVLITTGPLSGAVVHMRDGLIPYEDNGIESPQRLRRIAHQMMCVYEVPSSLDVSTELDDEIHFEFVKVFMK